MHHGEGKVFMARRSARRGSDPTSVQSQKVSWTVKTAKSNMESVQKQENTFRIQETFAFFAVYVTEGPKWPQIGNIGREKVTEYGNCLETGNRERKGGGGGGDMKCIYAFITEETTSVAFILTCSVDKSWILRPQPIWTVFTSFLTFVS